MSKRLVIAGAGGFGREVVDWVSSSPSWRRSAGVDTVVFIDDVRPSITLRAPVVSTIESYIPQGNDVFLCAVGAPRLRQTIVTSLEARGARAATFIDDRVTLGRNVSVGAGSIVCPETVIGTDACVGRHVHLNIRCTLGNDVAVNNFATVSPSCNIDARVVMLDSVFLGAAANIAKGLRVGENSRVGAGAIVVDDVSSGSTVVGNPARELGKSE